MMKRLVWADSLKGLLMLLVVLGHCIASTIGNDNANNDYLWCLIYSFHMPVFFAISGYLGYRGNTDKPLKIGGLVWRRFQQLMIPFIVWSLFYYLINIEIDKFFYCFLYPTNSYWFLWTLFFIVILFNFCEWISQKRNLKPEYLQLFMCILCGSILVVLNDVRIFGIQYILYYYIFYVLGYYVNKYALVCKNITAGAVLLVIWFVLGSFWKPSSLPDFLPFTGIFAMIIKFAYKFVIAFVAVFALFNIISKFLNHSSKTNNLLCEFGKVSLGIYIVHLIIVNYIINLFRLFIYKEWMIVGVSFIFLVILSYLFVKLLMKWNCSSRILLGKILIALPFLLFVFVSCEKESFSNLYLVGDSIVERWDGKKYFPDKRVLNLGKSGAGLQYLESLNGTMTGCYVVVLCGTNNLKKIDGNYVNNYICALRNMKANQLFVISVLPRENVVDDENINDNIANINEDIEDRVEQEGWFYINAYSYFILNDKINWKYYSDGLHLNEYGYELLSCLVREKMR